MPRLKNNRSGKFFLAVAAGLAVTTFFCRAQSPVIIQLSPQNPGAAIAADFAGLSFEMQRVLPDTNGDHFFSATNRALIDTFKTLGIKKLRVGGNTADRPTLPVPDENDVDNLFAFTKAADVKVIYTLRLNQGSPDVAAKMADYILQHYQQQLDCFAIGNEPNVFSTNYQVYSDAWKHFAAQIVAPTNSPDARFSGPGVSPGHEKWSVLFANEYAGGGLVKSISQHDYPGGDARKVKDPAVARDTILSPAMETHYAKFAANFVPTIVYNGLPYRLEEANSFYDGGALDVSDTFAAALWALDYQWWWAAHGASGINFHTGDKVAARDENKPCRYAAFWTSQGGFNIHPVGYALKMFSMGSRGRQLPVKVENTNDFNLAIYAAETGKDNLCVTLINREHGDSGRAAEIVLESGLTNAGAEVMLMTAPNSNIAAKTGIMLGGAEIQDDATWAGKWTPLAGSSTNGQFTLKLPAASAALVKITAR